MQKVFYLSKKDDKDLIEFLEGVGSNRQSEIIRKALRFYKENVNDGLVLDEEKVRRIVAEELIKLLGDKLRRDEQ